MIVLITADEVNDCLDFALAVRQSQKQFGTREIRESRQHTADTLIGKISELALQKFLIQKKLITAIDFAHYGAVEVTDNGQDIAAVMKEDQWHLCTYRVDSKGNAGTAQWLLVESHKYDQNYAQAYVMTKVLDIPRSSDLRLDPEIIRGKACRAEICGFVYHEDFHDEDGEFWYMFHQGDMLIHSRSIPKLDVFPSAAELKDHLNAEEALGRLEYYPVPMDARLNYGQPLSWLRNTREDWDELIERINENLTASDQKFISEYHIDNHNRVVNITTNG